MWPIRTPPADLQPSELVPQHLLQISFSVLYPSKLPISHNLTFQSVAVTYSVKLNVPVSETHWQNKMSRDEDNDASLVLINSGIPALSSTEHINFRPSHQGCLHSREKTGSSSLPSPFFCVCLFGPWLPSSCFKSVCAIQNLPHHIIFTSSHVDWVHTAISFWVSDRQGLESKCCVALFTSPFTPLSCPRRGFCCCISAFLLSVQEVPQNALILVAHRLKQT